MEARISNLATEIASIVVIWAVIKWESNGILSAMMDIMDRMGYRKIEEKISVNIVKKGLLSFQF